MVGLAVQQRTSGIARLQDLARWLSRVSALRSCAASPYCSAPRSKDGDSSLAAERDRVAGAPVRHGRVKHGRVGERPVLVLEPEVEA